MYGYQTSPDTPNQFLIDSTMASISANAFYPPPGYSLNFTGALGSLIMPNYLGYYELSSYNLTACGARCDATPGCLSFNIYFERTPQNVITSTCRTTSSAAMAKCALYGQYVNSTLAVNYGEYKNDFVVVIAGSSGFNRNVAPANLTGYTAPRALYGAINQSDPNVIPTFLGYSFYNTYDPSQCSSYCNTFTKTARTAAAAANKVSYTPCTYFNIFNLSLSGVSQGMYCQIFSDPSASQSATLSYTIQNNATYNVSNSYGYTASPRDPGNQGSCTALQSALGQSILDDNSMYYTLGCSYSLNATTIGSANGGSFSSCFKLCDAFTGCTAFSYSAGICNFKNVTGSNISPYTNTSESSAWQAAPFPGANAVLSLTSIAFVTSTTSVTSVAALVVATSWPGPTATIWSKVPVTTSTTSVFQSLVTTTTDLGTATTVSVITLTTTGVTTYRTVYPTAPSSCGNAGVAYAGYMNLPWTDTITPEFFKTKTPIATQIFTSTVTNTNTVTSTVTYTRSGTVSSSITVYTTTSVSISSSTAAATPTGLTPAIRYIGTAGAANQFYNFGLVDPINLAVSHVFYLYIGRGSGYYSFTFPAADDFSYLWVGSKAISGWTGANVDMYRAWTQTDITAITYYFTQGSYVPIRLMWYNTAGNAEISVRIFAPDGSLMMGPGSNSFAPYLYVPGFVSNPCDVTRGPAFLPFGSET